MPGRHVARMSPAEIDELGCAFLQRQDRKLGVVNPGPRHHREEDRLPAWKHLRPDVVALVVRRRQLHRLAASGVHPPEPAVRRIRSEHDGVVGSPRGASHLKSAWQLTDLRRRATMHGHPPKHAVAHVEESQPLAIGGKEGTKRQALGHHRSRHELTERPHLDLRCPSVPGDIGDVLPIGRNRHISSTRGDVERVSTSPADQDARQRFQSRAHEAPDRNPGDDGDDHRGCNGDTYRPSPPRWLRRGDQGRDTWLGATLPDPL